MSSRSFLGLPVRYFSSSHERSHLLCAYGMSGYPAGTPVYALVWEGAVGAFYEIDQELNIRRLGDVMNQPGNRYIAIYGLADPTFPKSAPYSRFSDAGKLMALTSFSKRRALTEDEERLASYFLSPRDIPLNPYRDLRGAPFWNVGIDDEGFRNFAGVYSDRIFDAFLRFARQHMPKRLPLLISGGCGLNCDWNTKWRESGLFEDVFVPPVANDSGSAIGTAVDAQLHLTGNPKIQWDVYSGLDFRMEGHIDLSRYHVADLDSRAIAHLLSRGLVLGWVCGRFEIGPRALGNRSILAAPFSTDTRDRLNGIKQREEFRPIAPVCRIEEAEALFGCTQDSPYMLYTFAVRDSRLAAVTHVNGTARLQTVCPMTNQRLYALLTAFKRLTGYGVLCNTSLNFSGKGFINNIADLDRYTRAHELDGFVVDGRGYLLKRSAAYQAYRRAFGPASGSSRAS